MVGGHAMPPMRAMGMGHACAAAGRYAYALYVLGKYYSCSYAESCITS